MSDTTAKDVAAWMLTEVQKKGLEQQQAAWDIKRKFGKGFVYDNAHGNPAISKDVLKEFRAVSDESVVWSRTERAWRKRRKFDKPGREQE